MHLLETRSWYCRSFQPDDQRTVTFGVGSVSEYVLPPYQLLTGPEWPDRNDHECAEASHGRILCLEVRFVLNPAILYRRNMDRSRLDEYDPGAHAI
jgi:hypothetical protein